jgi:hypothetical protein
MMPTISTTEMAEVKELKKINWDEMLIYLEKQKEAFKRVRVIALGYTRASDWVNIDGVAFPMHSGMAAIAGPFGVNMDNLTHEKLWHEDKKGRYYEHRFTARFYSDRIGRSIYMIGSCTSRDLLYGRKGGDFKELEDVDERMIEYKALTSLQRKGIASLLGLLNVQWTEVQSAGIDLAKVRKVDHTGAAKDAQKDFEAAQKTAPPEKKLSPGPASPQQKPPEQKKEAPKETKKEEAPKETKKENGKVPEGPAYPPEIIDLCGKLVNHISNANNLAELQETWTADKADRQKLAMPEYRTLFDDVTKAKDTQKARLIKKEEEEKAKQEEDKI